MLFFRQDRDIAIMNPQLQVSALYLNKNGQAAWMEKGSSGAISFSDETLMDRVRQMGSH